METAIGLACFQTPFLNSALGVALPSIGQDFGLSPHEMALAMVAQLVVAAALLTPFGRLSDYLGRRRIFLAGSALFSAASLTVCLSPSAHFVYAGRFLQGLGDAMTFGVSSALLLASAPPDQRGRVLGYNLAWVYGGLALGPVLSGLVTAWLSWRLIFALTAAVGLTAFTLLWRHGRSIPDERQTGRFDFPGAALYSPAVFCLILGLSLQPSLSGLALLAGGAALIPWLVRVERGHPAPLLDLGMLAANRTFAAANLTSVLGYTAAFSVSFLLSLYFQKCRGLGADTAGLLLLLQPAIQAVCSPLAGSLSDRVRPERLTSLGLALLCLGLWGLGLVSPDTPLSWIAALQVTLGLGFSLFASPNVHAIMDTAPPGYQGLASGLLATMRTAGMAVSMAATGVALAVVVGQARTGDVGPQVMVSLRICFWCFGAVALAGIWITLRGGSPIGRTSG